MTVEYKDSKRISALSSDFPITTTTYDHIGDTNNAGLHAINTAGGHDGLKVGIKIIAGSPAIGTKIEYVSMSIRKWGSSTGNYQFQVIDGTDGTTVLASATSSASALTETPATVELQLDSIVTLSVNDRIVLSYPDGSGSNIVGLARNSATTESGYNRTILGYSTTTWSDSTVNNMIMTFDSSPVTVSKPTNVQDNSILVEKDTGIRYWFSESSESLASSQTSSNDGFGVQLNPSSEDSKLGAKLHSSNGAVGKSISKVIFQLRNPPSSSSSYGIPCKIYNASNTLVATSTNTPNFTDLVKGAWATPYTNYNIEYTFSPAVAVAADYRIVVEPQGGTQDVDGTNMRVTSSSSDSSLFLVSFRGGAWRADSTYSSWDPVIYLYESVPATWTINPTFEDDFSTYANTTAGDAVWATNDTARMRVNPSTDVFDFTTTRNGTASTSYKTLTSVSDTAWLLRFRFNMTSSTSDARLFVGLSSTTGNYGSTEDWLGIIIPNRQHTTWSIRGYDGAAVTIGTYDSFSLTPSLATDYFVELIRVSATSFKLNLYSDSGYSTLINSVTHTIPSTLVGLSYLKIMNMNNDSAGYSMTGIIDDVSFYNGVSSV